MKCGIHGDVLVDLECSGAEASRDYRNIEEMRKNIKCQVVNKWYAEKIV